MNVTTVATEVVSEHVYPFMLELDDSRGPDYRRSILVVESKVERSGSNLKTIVVADQIFPRSRSWLTEQLISIYGWNRSDAEKAVYDAWWENDSTYAKRQWIGDIPVFLHYRRRVVKNITYFYESGLSGALHDLIRQSAPHLEELVSLHLSTEPDQIDRAIELNIDLRSSVKRPYGEQMIYLTRKVRSLR